MIKILTILNTVAIIALLLRGRKSILRDCKKVTNTIQRLRRTEHWFNWTIKRWRDPLAFKRLCIPKRGPEQHVYRKDMEDHY